MMIPARPPALATLAALLLATVGSTRAAHPARTLSLAPVAEVAAEGVFLDQILHLSPPAPLPHLRVLDAPALGQTASLSRAQVDEWLRRNAPDLATTNWTGLDRIRISRRTRSLDEVELRDLLRDTLQREHVKDRGELELRLTRPWASLQVPAESVALRIVDLPATGPSANFICRFELWNGEERLGNWQVSASARIWRDVPVALVPLRRGQSLPASDVAIERRDVLALRDAPGAFALDDPSLELVENLSAGQPILARSVRPRPVILRSQLIDGIVHDGGLTITLKVEALQDGLPGQIIRVRNPKTRRELTGKVLNEQTLLIAW